jgi:hypothetical protein
MKEFIPVTLACCEAFPNVSPTRRTSDSKTTETIWIAERTRALEAKTHAARMKPKDARALSAGRAAALASARTAQNSINEDVAKRTAPD